MRIFFDKWLFGFLRLTGPNPGLLHGLDCYKMRVTLRRGGWWRREGGASTECQRRCGQRQRPGAHLNISPAILAAPQGVEASLQVTSQIAKVSTLSWPLTDIMVVIGLTIILLPSRSPGRKSMSVPSSPRLRAWYTILSISLFSLRFSPASSGLCSGILDSSCNAQSNSLKPISPLIPFVLPLRNTLWWKRPPTEHCLLLTNGVNTVNPIWPRGGGGADCKKSMTVFVNS